jgi:hypothetical protein
MRRGIVALSVAAGRNKCCSPASSVLRVVTFQIFLLVAACSSFQPACSCTTLRRNVHQASNSNQKHHQLADVQGRETSRKSHVHDSLSDCKIAIETKALLGEKQHESWEAMRKQLADYCDQYGDCNVPNKWPDNKELRNWVRTQRMQKKNFYRGLYASITKERIASLDSMGFSWNPKKDSWEAMRKQLAEYCDQYGNCNVPKTWPDNKSLGKWVLTQRKQKKNFDQALHASITKERIASLDSLGFSWNSQKESWEAMRKQLADYCNQYGDCKVPSKWSDNKELRNWVRTQRMQKKKFDRGLYASITKERIASLDSMGFSWNSKEESWEAMRKQLAEYCDQYGDCKVPTRWPDNRALGQWVSMQRMLKKKFDRGLHASITKERIASLDSMGFSWNPKEASWEPMRKQLADYCSQYGDCNVPNQWPDNKKLRNWVGVGTQRNQKRKFD